MNELWHWTVEVRVGDRVPILETGDMSSPEGAWIRAGEALRRRGDDLALAAREITAEWGTHAHRQGNEHEPLEVRVTVAHVP